MHQNSNRNTKLKQIQNPRVIPNNMQQLLNTRILLKYANQPIHPKHLKKLIKSRQSQQPKQLIIVPLNILLLNKLKRNRRDQINKKPSLQIMLNNNISISNQIPFIILIYQTHIDQDIKTKENIHKQVKIIQTRIHIIQKANQIRSDSQSIKQNQEQQH